MKNIYLLGATGSIGMQVLEVIASNKDYVLKSISVGENITRTKAIIEEFMPEYVSVLKEEDCYLLQKLYPNISFGYGEKGLIKAATYSEDDGDVINAVVGMVGLKPTIEAIKKKRNILLANKETLVVAGEIITKLIKEYNVKLIPIDSEHSAIYQCLVGHNIKDVSRLIITASGGAFRDKSKDELEDVTLADALNHPNWSMGKKITIDSATMVNKGLEVIEAHFLFNIPYDKIETIIHYESIIHSLVEYNDYSIIAQMSYPDMRLPIQYALTTPNHKANLFGKQLNLNIVNNLSFKKMDYNRYPCLKMAYDVGKMGGIMPTVYNVSNEEAVNLFINGKIKFVEIEKIIEEMIKNTKNIINPSLQQIFSTAQNIKAIIKNKYL